MNIFEITSTQNDLVKYAVKLQDSKTRRNEKMILVDGEQTIEGFINDGVVFEYYFVKKEDGFQKDAKIENLVFVNDAILKKISTTKTPTNCVGIIKEPEVNFDDFLKLNKIALIDSIKDAGNLGTIIRSAAAFSIDGIILYGDCVDLYNSKTIRAAAQNIFKLPVFRTKDLNLVKKLKQNHKFISTVVNSKNDFFNYKFDDKFVLAFGSEADGIGDEIAKLSDEKITMTMDNDVESLNLAVCASIAFALIRQK